MKKLLLLAAAIVAISLISGCGKDSTSEKAGDQNDASYLAAKSDIDSTIIEMTEDDNDAAAWLSEVMTKPADLDTTYFDSTSFWHTYLYQHEGELLTYARVDSFRFSDFEDDHQQNRNDSTDIFEHRIHKYYTYTNIDTTIVWQKSRNRNVLWSGFTDSVLVLTGAFDRSYAGEAPGVTFNHTFSGTFDSVRYYTLDFLNGLPTHPISGRFMGTKNFLRATDNRIINFTSTITITFYEDHYNVHLIAGSNYWDWDHYYDQ
jgi:hypothetical protein